MPVFGVRSGTVRLSHEECQTIILTNFFNLQESEGISKKVRQETIFAKQKDIQRKDGRRCGKSEENGKNPGTTRKMDEDGQEQGQVVGIELNSECQRKY